jgi:hypothetical protein
MTGPTENSVTTKLAAVRPYLRFAALEALREAEAGGTMSG